MKALRRFLHLGLLTQGTSRLQVGLPLHLNCNRVEVVGGDTGLCHFSKDGLSVHRLVYGHVGGQHSLVHGEGPDVKVVDRLHPLHLQKAISHLAVLHPRRSAVHQDYKNVPQDGEGSAQDKDGEQEGADGVRDLIFWLEEDNNGAE